MIKGTKHSKSSIDKMKLSLRNIENNHLHIGENAYHWKGGKTTRERKILMGRQEYRQWRINVLERDNYTCQCCGIRGVELHCHHIKSFYEYIKLRYNVDNGVVLCRHCHELTHTKNK